VHNPGLTSAPGCSPGTLSSSPGTQFAPDLGGADLERVKFLKIFFLRKPFGGAGLVGAAKKK